jgi:hypothetical protein
VHRRRSTEAVPGQRAPSLCGLLGVDDHRMPIPFADHLAAGAVLLDDRAKWRLESALWQRNLRGLRRMTCREGPDVNSPAETHVISW